MTASTSRARCGDAAPHYDPEAFGRLSEQIARFLGTARFIVYMTRLRERLGDLERGRGRSSTYPFVFTTLMLSLGRRTPLILLAQNRQGRPRPGSGRAGSPPAEQNQAELEYRPGDRHALRIAWERSPPATSSRPDRQIDQLDGKRSTLP